jgi:hypothetical protein
MQTAQDNPSNILYYAVCIVTICIGCQSKVNLLLQRHMNLLKDVEIQGGTAHKEASYRVLHNNMQVCVSKLVFSCVVL